MKFHSIKWSNILFIEKAIEAHNTENPIKKDINRINMVTVSVVDKPLWRPLKNIKIPLKRKMLGIIK